MIITNKAHALDYLGISDRLDTALRYISNTDLNNLADGNHLIDGEDVRVKVQHMQTKPLEMAKLEAHNDFADIQMLLDGSECIGWCFRTDALTETEAAPERDIYFYARDSSSSSSRTTSTPPASPSMSRKLSARRCSR